MQKIVEPTVTPTDMGEKYSHPAYCFIRASRVSGHTNLHDSDFNHQQFITVTIGRSVVKRHLSNNWHYDRAELIQIQMSESQWGHFVSSMNAGSTPCTMSRGPLPDSGYKMEMIPSLPSPKPVTEQFDKELLETLADARKRLDEVTTALTNAEKPMSKREQVELAKSLNSVRQNIGVNVSFVADQFSEHVERTVNKAKTEFNAFKMNHVLKVGSQTLIGDMPELPTLERQ